MMNVNRGVALALLLPTSAAAHHVGGDPTHSAWHALLSGMGHPVIDVAHCLFIIAMGLLLGASSGRAGYGIAVFLLATLTGAAVHLTVGAPAMLTLLTALTIVLAAGLIITAARWPSGVLLTLAGAAGLVHGLAYAGSILGAHSGAIASYFAGFTLTQALILGLAAMLGGYSRRLPTALQNRCRWASGGVILASGLLVI